jgi:GAF domain-containing protein/HAMP domain-containing protein
MGLWKSFRNLGLGLKLGIALTIGMAILLTAVMVVVVFSARNLTTQAGLGRARQESEVIQSRFKESRQDVLKSAELVLSQLALEESVAKGTDAVDLRSRMALVLRMGRGLDYLSVVDSNGVYITGVHEGEGGIIISPQQEELLSLSLSGSGSEATGVIFDADGPALWLAAAIPVRGQMNEVIGAFLAARRVDDELLQELNFSREDVHLALVANGRILAQDFPDPRLLSEFSSALAAEPQTESALSEEIVVADILLQSTEGVPYALAHSYFREVDVSIAVLVDMNELYTFQRQLMTTTALVLGLLALVAVIGMGIFTRSGITIPLRKLRSAAERMASGDYEQLAEVKSRDEVGQLADAFNNMTMQLRQTLESLQQRGADLERRSVQLLASAEVARGAVSILETERLIQQVVDLIRERFNLYYVGLFLLDDAGEWVVLQAGTGEAGRAMLARDHRIKAGEGMIGWCIANGQARLAEEAETDQVRVIVEELPDTRSELALPLRSRGRVFGALSVQSDRPAAFDEQTISVLQTMADQVAVAIENARLFAESQSALQAERRAYGQLAGRAWRDLLRTHANWGYRYDQHTVAPVEGDWTPEMQQVEQTGRAVVSSGEDGGGAKLAVPIRVRGRMIGVLRFRKSEADETWASTEVAMLETLADQLGQALEGARLYQNTLQRAARERLIGEITGRVRETLDMEIMLRTAVQEIRRTLALPEVTIRLAPGQREDGRGNGAD